MTTVWIDNGSEQDHDADRSFVDIRVTNVTQWLNQITENL